MVIGGFATLTMLVKNSFLDEIHKLYVTTARAKAVRDALIERGVDRKRQIRTEAFFD